MPTGEHYWVIEHLPATWNATVLEHLSPTGTDCNGDGKIKPAWEKRGPFARAFCNNRNAPLVHTNTGYAGETR